MGRAFPHVTPVLEDYVGSCLLECQRMDRSLSRACPSGDKLTITLQTVMTPTEQSVAAVVFPAPEAP